MGASPASSCALPGSQRAIGMHLLYLEGPCPWLIHLRSNAWLGIKHSVPRFVAMLGSALALFSSAFAGQAPPQPARSSKLSSMPQPRASCPGVAFNVE